MRLLHLLYETAAFIIWDCCIYYMGLLYLLYGTAVFIICNCCIYYMGLLNIKLLYIYATAAFIICSCCIYIYQVHIQMYVLHLLYAHAAFTYGAPAFIYVFIYDVRAICINFDTNGTP